MADWADRTQVDTDVYLRASLQAALPGAQKLESRNFYAECEEPIPQARREAVPGCQLCIDCQSAAETKK